MPAHDLPRAPLKGIGFKLASVVVFIGMYTLIKLASDRVPPGEMVFFRAFFAIPVILVWLGTSRAMGAGLRTTNFTGHIWRGLAGTCAMGFGFAGLAYLPLPEVTAIGYAAPLLTVIFAAMFLGEDVRAFRMATVGLGLVGVLIILSPRLSVGHGAGEAGTREALGAMLVLSSALFAALAQVFVRKLVAQETTSAIVFYFSVNSAVLSLITLPMGWVWPDMSTALILIASGFLGGVGQVFLTSSYRHADASLVAPFEYASMILSLAVGYFAFSEVPTGRVLLGAVLVIAAGILIIWRERRLGLERAAQRRSMTP